VNIVDEAKRLTCAETAKLVRKELAKKFPSQKFSVRSDSYAGGASVDISWENGLPQSVVEKVVDKFSGAGFDGMVDLQYYKYHWLLPDGSVKIAHSEYEEIDTQKPKGAVAVQFGADFIMCHRHLTDEVMITIAKDVSKFGKLIFDGNMNASLEYDNRWFDWWILAGHIASTGNLDNYKGVKMVNSKYELL
jgi:hypothetical protein